MYILKKILKTRVSHIWKMLEIKNMLEQVSASSFKLLNYNVINSSVFSACCAKLAEAAHFSCLSCTAGMCMILKWGYDEVTVTFCNHCAWCVQRNSPMLSNTAAFTSVFSSLYTDAILRKASVVFATSDMSTYSEVQKWGIHLGLTCSAILKADHIYGIPLPMLLPAAQLASLSLPLI